MAENWIDKLKRKIKVYYGKGTAVIPKTGRADFVTQGTMVVEEALKNSRISDVEIARLRGKKKLPAVQRKSGVAPLRYVERNGIRFPVR